MESFIFDSQIVKIRVFKLDPDQSQFNQQSCIKYPLVVFPKNPIWIKHESKQAFVADTSLVNFYNQDQVYNRYAIDPSGDYCHNFDFAEDILAELMGTHKKATNVFDFENLYASKETFIAKLQLLNVLEIEKEFDTLAIEEKSIALVSKVLEGRSRQSDIRVTNRQRARHRKLIEAVKSTLQNNLSLGLSLQELAREHHISAFHLSRLFRQQCGLGISQYRTQQRLRAAAFGVLRGEDLTTLAMDCGFSSHSHLTASFKKYFGNTPSEFRNEFRQIPQDMVYVN